jgi:hypothetical protein
MPRRNVTINSISGHAHHGRTDLALPLAACTASGEIKAIDINMKTVKTRANKQTKAVRETRICLRRLNRPGNRCLGIAETSFSMIEVIPPFMFLNICYLLCYAPV